MSHHFNPLDGTSSKKPVTIDELKAVLHLSQTDAAKYLGLSSFKLRSVFKKFREELQLCRWPTQKARNTIIKTLYNNSNVSMKQEEEEFPTDHNGFPLFNKTLLYNHRVRNGEFPFSSFKPLILYLPSPLENNSLNVKYESIYTGHTEDDMMYKFDKYEMQEFLEFVELKRLEKDICDRLIGRVANGFKKQVFCMPITKCAKGIFTKYFDMYGEYCKIHNRTTSGYDRIGDFTKGQSMRYVFHFPYLPTFGNGHWTLNQYSILNSDDDDDNISICSSSSSVSIISNQSSTTSPIPDFSLPDVIGDELLSEELQEFKEHFQQQVDFNEGWDHIRNMVYRLSVAHNSITDMVTVSFGMISLKLWSDMTFKETL